MTSKFSRGSESRPQWRGLFNNVFASDFTQTWEKRCCVCVCVLRACHKKPTVSFQRNLKGGVWTCGFAATETLYERAAKNLQGRYVNISPRAPVRYCNMKLAGYCRQIMLPGPHLKGNVPPERKIWSLSSHRKVGWSLHHPQNITRALQENTVTALA